MLFGLSSCRYGFAMAATLMLCLIAPRSGVADLLSANPDPFTEAEVLSALERYGAQGSGVDLARPSGVALQRSDRGLVSEVVVISGSTGVFGDPSGFGFTVDLSGDYLFDFDKYDLTRKAQKSLEEVLALYKEYDGQRIVITGHTDSKGSESYNQTLSERRAETVRDWFVRNGIEAAHLTATGRGEREPVAPNEVGGADNPEGRALNRRVSIHVTTAKRVNFQRLDQK